MKVLLYFVSICDKNFSIVFVLFNKDKIWSDMKVSEYKGFEGIRKEFVRDNMADIVVLQNKSVHKAGKII